VLPWEDVLADMNKGVLEAYLLANVHVLCLIEVGKDIPEINMLFFQRCLSAVMEVLRNRKVEPELVQSLKIYNASRCSRSPRVKKQAHQPRVGPQCCCPDGDDDEERVVYELWSTLPQVPEAHAFDRWKGSVHSGAWNPES
jgi:hypothetical protein